MTVIPVDFHKKDPIIAEPLYEVVDPGDFYAALKAISALQQNVTVLARAIKELKDAAPKP